MRDRSELHIYGSRCCRGETIKLVEALRVRVSPGSTHYYYNRCNECGAPCDLELMQLFDTSGTEVRIGDIIHCPEQLGFAWEYHAVFEDERGFIEIRDLGHNNVHMYQQQGGFFTVGPYWRHLDKLDEEDLEYYWGTTREEALKVLEVRG